MLKGRVMPIYEYQCECNGRREMSLPLSRFDEPQVCECGKTMQRKMSGASFVMKPTGKGMALDTINSDVVGGKRKEWAKSMAAQGL